MARDKRDALAAVAQALAGTRYAIIGGAALQVHQAEPRRVRPLVSTWPASFRRRSVPCSKACQNEAPHGSFLSTFSTVASSRTPPALLDSYGYLLVNNSILDTCSLT